MLPQCVPGGGSGGSQAEGAAGSRDGGVLRRAHQLPERLHPQLSPLLCRRAAANHRGLHALVHHRRQQDLQRLLERAALTRQELQHLLPSPEQSQWGECVLPLRSNWPAYSHLFQHNKVSPHDQYLVMRSINQGQREHFQFDFWTHWLLICNLEPYCCSVTDSHGVTVRFLEKNYRLLV